MILPLKPTRMHLMLLKNVENLVDNLEAKTTENNVMQLVPKTLSTNSMWVNELTYSDLMLIEQMLRINTIWNKSNVLLILILKLLKKSKELRPLQLNNNLKMKWLLNKVNQVYLQTKLNLNKTLLT